MAAQDVRFGIVADCQYGTNPDCDDPPRYFASSLQRLQDAVAAWQRATPSVHFVLNCGDTIDGGATAEESEQHMQKVVDVINTWGRPRPEFIHCIGNHCLVNNSREVVQRLLGTAGYEVRELPYGWALVVLDTTEISVVDGDGGWGKDHPNYTETQALLAEHPLESSEDMMPWNGTISSRQAMWLEQVLAARPRDKKTIVAMHHPLVGPSAQHYAWRPQGLLQLLDRHAAAVHTVFSGHYHEGMYTKRGSIHYLGIHAMLSFKNNAFGVVTLKEDGTVVVDGCGTAQPDHTLEPLADETQA